MNIIKDLWTDGLTGRIILGSIFAIIVLSVFSIFASIENSKKWEEYKVVHNCKIVGHKKGSTSTGIVPMVGGNGGTGVIVTQTQDQTGWLCDDGVTYWR